MNAAKVAAADEKENELCPRTFAIYRLGEKIDGVKHRIKWAGIIPRTGVRRCSLCGAIFDDE